jgi:hypothetical protein
MCPFARIKNLLSILFLKSPAAEDFLAEFQQEIVQNDVLRPAIAFQEFSGLIHVLFFFFYKAHNYVSTNISEKQRNTEVQGC